MTDVEILTLITDNELCERFSLFGARSLLFIYLRSIVALPFQYSHFLVHSHISLTYFCSFIGFAFTHKIMRNIFKVIVLFGFIYLIGTGFLLYNSISDHSMINLYLSLILISFGSGILKSCSLILRERNANNNRQVNIIQKILYYIFYLASFLSIIWAPVFADISCLGKESCFPISFLLSSLLLLSILIYFFFTSGTLNLSNISSHNLLADSIKAIINSIKNILCNKKIENFSSSKVYDENLAYILRKFHFFEFLVPITFFWILYDQQYTLWLEQALEMKSKILNDLKFVPIDMPIINNLIMIAFIPILTNICYPILKKIKKIDPFSKLTLCMVLSALAYILSAMVDLLIEYSKEKISILWQMPQYILMGFSEVFINMDILEYIKSQCSTSVWESFLSLWLLGIALANIFAIMILKLISNFQIANQQKSLIICFLNGMLGFWLSIKCFKKKFKENKKV